MSADPYAECNIQADVQGSGTPTDQKFEKRLGAVADRGMEKTRIIGNKRKSLAECWCMEAGCKCSVPGTRYHNDRRLARWTDHSREQFSAPMATVGPSVMPISKPV